MTTTAPSLNRPSYFTLLLIVAVLILGWIVFGNGCGHGAPAPAVNIQQAKDSIKILTAINKRRADSLKEYKLRDSYNNEVIEEVGALYFQADSAMGAERLNVRSVQRELAAAKLARDTARQLRDCDTLNQRVTLLQEKCDEADKQATDYVFKTSRELYVKDSVGDIKDRQIAGLQRQADLCDTVNKNTPALKRLPAIRGYLGATVATGAYSTLGVHLDLINRNDIMYKGSVKIGISGPVYEIGVSKLLSFKKH